MRAIQFPFPKETAVEVLRFSCTERHPLTCGAVILCDGRTADCVHERLVCRSSLMSLRRGEGLSLDEALLGTYRETPEKKQSKHEEGIRSHGEKTKPPKIFMVIASRAIRLSQYTPRSSM